jgi:metallo-beta-lactamase class B
MARNFDRRGWLLFGLGLLTPFALFGFLKWREAGRNGGQQPAEPFRIAGNFYYVGANDVTSFLITGSEGHVLLDGGYPGTPPLILQSIATLGFDIKDVKVLLNSMPLPDHAGGLAELQRVSGAQLWASEPSGDVLAAGGDNPDMARPLRLLIQSGIFGYAAPRVDRRFKDGEKIRLGQIELTAHITGGSTRGCTSYSFQVKDGDRLLNVVSACPLGVTVGFRYREQQADLERSFQVLRSLPADIWVTSRARAWGRYRKFLASRESKNPVDAFIDPQGYRAFIDAAEADLRAGVVH